MPRVNIIETINEQNGHSQWTMSRYVYKYPTMMNFIMTYIKQIDQTWWLIQTHIPKSEQYGNSTWINWTRIGEQFRFTYTINIDKLLKCKKYDLNNEYKSNK